MMWIVLIVVFLLAFSNGANDNFKGVATLFGTGTTDYKKALSWATITTLLGSITSVFLAEVLVKNFSGKGLVPDVFLASPAFACSVALGAALTILLATKIGMPVSTTHSLVGALTGCGLMAVGASFNFSKLGSTFFLPLLISPVLAGVLSVVIYFVFTTLRKKWGITKESCLCVKEDAGYIPSSVTLPIRGRETSFPPASRGGLAVRQGKINECAEQYNGTIIGIGAQSVLDTAHFISAGVVSFARGLNDTPKIAGLLLLLSAFNIQTGIVIIAFMMVLGGILNARKVADTMSNKITQMNHGQGFTANLITSLLVTTASVHGLPVSTTHVSVGALFGIGTVTGKANKKVIGEILLSWVLTLPVAGIISSLIYFILNNSFLS